MARLWDKGEPLDERILRYTAGEDHKLDARLVPYDVVGSKSHARMLMNQGLLTAEDCDAICSGLGALAAAHERGEWEIELADEDVHTALETRLDQAIGEPARRLHAGRSRNDQVLTALRLYTKDAATALAAGAESVAEALAELERRQGETALPGYTHMQQAMPSSVALWSQGFAAELRDDAAAIRSAGERANLNPLGSAAGYGTPGLPIDREQTRKDLGFARIQEPVTAVQLSRGKAEASLVFELTVALADLGRLAADLLLFYTQEFAYVELPTSLTTGSSIMPQKRNPDVLELVRGASAVAQGALVEILSTTAKLPSGYHRDLQRLKAPLFRTIDLAGDTFEIVAHTVGQVAFRPEKILLTKGLNAAEAANKLVRDEGIPFRDAYRRVAGEPSDGA